MSESNPFTAAERAEVKAVLDAIEAALRGAPVLARPEGYEVEPVFVALGDLVPTRDKLYTYQYRVLFWVPRREGQVEPNRRVIVTVNPSAGYLLEVPGRGAFGRYGEDEFDEVFYWAPKVTGPLPGGGVVYDGLDYPLASFAQGVYIAGDDSPFLPVSRERVMRAELARAEESDSVLAAATATTPYERWIGEAAQRREIHEGSVAQLLAMGLTDEAAKARESFERTEREVAESLKARGSIVPDLSGVPLLSVGIRRQLAAMSPAELARQACFDVLAGYWSDEGVEGGMQFAFVPPSPDADCLVTGNRVFYAARGNPVTPRIIDVWAEVDGAGYVYSELLDGSAVKIFETLDWAALAAVVRTQD